MSTKPIADWECWFLKHRADEISVLVIESLRIILRKGSMSAEDVHHIPVKNPSVRGELMKCLRRMGVAKKSELAEGTTKQSHGHTLFVWTLCDAQRAREILDRCAGILLPPQEPKTEKQLELC